jgi:hypothetical protein
VLLGEHDDAAREHGAERRGRRHEPLHRIVGVQSEAMGLRLAHEDPARKPAAIVRVTQVAEPPALSPRLQH